LFPQPAENTETRRPHHVPSQFCTTHCGRQDRRAEQTVPELPLFAHVGGVWAEKIRGKLHHFDPWADPDGAEAKYLVRKGAKDQPSTDHITSHEVLLRSSVFRKTISHEPPRTVTNQVRAWLFGAVGQRG
jgi:hypothetical protein